MRKLKLEITELRVESFVVSAAEGRGTVDMQAKDPSTKETPESLNSATNIGACEADDVTGVGRPGTCICPISDESCRYCTDPSCVSCELTCADTCGSCNPFTCDPTVDMFGPCCAA